MQHIQHIFGNTLQTLLGWVFVISGLAVISILLRFNERRQRKFRPIVVAPQIERRSCERDRRALTGIVEGRISGVEAIEALQAHAALQVDAAEHAFNRMLEDCGAVMTVAVAPTLQPMRELTRESEPVRSRLPPAPLPRPVRRRAAAARGPATASPPPAP